MSKSIKCIKCGTVIDLTEAIYNDIKDDLESTIDIEVKKRTEEFNRQIEILTQNLNKYAEESAKAKSEIAKLESELLVSKDSLEAEVNKRLIEERNNIYIELREKLEVEKKNIQTEAELKLQEKLDTIRQLKEQLDIAKKKAEQGSMQQQGEAQEVLIEEFLKETFPLDTIEEVKKGAMGADCLQVVNTRNKLNVGTIYYESKRTKNFNNGWIDKFKEDILNKGADVGILVSSARPSGVDRACNIKGVWVCTLDEFKILSHVIRDFLVRINTVKSLQENKGTKMEVLYDYLTSNEFKLQIESIIDGFSQMKSDLESEKRAMKQIWAKREKQIHKVIDNTINMYGSIKGIGGNNIQSIPSLELN